MSAAAKSAITKLRRGSARVAPNGKLGVPFALTEPLAKIGEAAKRAFAALMTTKTIEVAAIEAAVHAHA